VDDGDTSWMLLSTMLVLLMCPALAVFEAGMLRAKNTLSIVTQVFSGVVVLSVLWFAVGYSFVFHGNLSRAFFINGACRPVVPRVQLCETGVPFPHHRDALDAELRWPCRVL
jgi:Amt family ammonium transporter